MKTSTILTLAFLVAKASADCFSTKLGYPCCSGNEVKYVDSDGKWGIENNQWCGISSNGTYAMPIKTIIKTIGEQFTHSGNPFAGHEFFINPYYTAEVDQAIAQMS
ncbi:family 6 glycoside hydrolase, partial [Piromyces sp. E2]